MVLWLVGGIMALCGALSYAELAAAFPRSGGEYNFLSRIYHQAVGFMAGWVSATVGFAAPVALAAMAFGQYLTGVIPGSPPLLMALLVVWLVTAVQLAGIQQAAAFQNISTLLKVALILLFIVAGFAVGEPQAVSFAPSAADWGYITSAPFFISLFYVMYSYAGWNAATYIASEIRDPRRDLPLSHADRRGTRDAALRGAQCRVPLHHADLQAGGPARRRPRRRQADLRRCRRAHRRRA